MKKKTICVQLSAALSVAFPGMAGAQANPDLAVLPLAEPARAKVTELDVRNAKAPHPEGDRGGEVMLEGDVKKRFASRPLIGAIGCVLATLVASPASAQDAAALAKAAQNPIADMISLPFQSNTNFDVGPLKKT
jgi:hypothetical protein